MIHRDTGPPLERTQILAIHQSRDFKPYLLLAMPENPSGGPATQRTTNDGGAIGGSPIGSGPIAGGPTPQRRPWSSAWGDSWGGGTKPATVAPTTVINTPVLADSFEETDAVFFEPTPEAARTSTVETASPVTASMSATEAADTLSAEATVSRPVRLVLVDRISEEPAALRDAAAALLAAVNAEIEQQKDRGSNDSEYLDFLESLADGLTKLIDALNRLAATSDREQQRILAGSAAKIADAIKAKIVEWFDLKSVEVIDRTYNATLFCGAVSFLHFCGVPLTDIVKYFAGVLTGRAIK